MHRRFLFRLVLLTLPFAIWLGPPLAVIMLSGEYEDLDRIIQTQADSHRNGGTDEVLYGPAFTNPTQLYKMLASQSTKANWVALGSSRVMKFRARFFKEPQHFYNAGGAIWNVYHLEPWLERIPIEHQPQLILLGVDQWNFNPNWHPGTKGLAGMKLSPWDSYDQQRPLHTLQKDWRRLWQEIGLGYLGPRELFFGGMLLGGTQITRVGLQAMKSNSGFRRDGSWSYGRFDLRGQLDPQSPDHLFKDTFQRMDIGSGQYSYSDKSAPSHLEPLERFLKACAERGITVITFLPPFAHTVVTHMRNMADKYRWVFETSQIVRPVVEKHRGSFFDFTDIMSVGSNDKEAIDGHHGSEKTYLRIILAIADKNARLRALVDVNELRQQLSESVTDCSVYPDVLLAINEQQSV